jgi:fermentation-respiration switch protein FrsA (DUF1100 family)
MATQLNVLPSVDPSLRETVRFQSDGLALAGHLYRPPTAAPGERTAALVMAGPMTSVKEETLPHYAAPLAEAGYSVLAFDNRNFGESDGEPRQHLVTSEQVEDLKNAVSYLLTREDVDPERLGLCCVCMGAGYGLAVASMDLRVRAVALVAGAYNITDTYREFLGDEGFASYLETLNAARRRQYESGELQYMPAIAGPPDYAPSAMPVQEAYEYYSRAQATEAPNWENRLTVASMEQIVGWNVLARAHLVAPRPLLVIHGTTDVLLPPRYAQEVYERAGEPKRLRRIETSNHVELYDQAPFVPEAIAAVLDWLGAHLPTAPTLIDRSDGGVI